MKPAVQATIVAVACVLATSLARAQELHTFKRIQLNDQFWSEGANFGDLNNDGVNDIISGPWWWEGPDFKKRHEYYPGDDDVPVEARADDDGHGARLRGHARQGEQVLGQLLRLGPRLQQGRLERHPHHRLPRARTRRGSRIPKGKDGALDAPQGLRSDGQRVADLRRSHRRRQAGARLHHEGPVRLRRAGLERSGEAVDVPSDLAEQQVRQLHARHGRRRRQRRRAARPAREERLVGAARVARGRSGLDVSQAAVRHRRRADVRLRRQRRRPQRHHHRARRARLRPGVVRAVIARAARSRSASTSS